MMKMLYQRQNQNKREPLDLSSCEERVLLVWVWKDHLLVIVWVRRVQWVLISRRPDFTLSDYFISSFCLKLQPGPGRGMPAGRGMGLAAPPGVMPPSIAGRPMAYGRPPPPMGAPPGMPGMPPPGFPLPGIRPPGFSGPPPGFPPPGQFRPPPPGWV